MHFEKIILDTIERCYSTGVLHSQGKLYAVFASESIDGPCYAYTGDKFRQKEVIWEKAGGTMSLIQIPKRDGEFIAVQGFFPGFRATDARLVWGKCSSSGWDVKDLVHLPYVHRFDLFHVEDEIHLLAATLCSSKKDREDWSDPGKILSGRLPAKPEDGITFREICTGQTKNHGYCRGRWQGREAAFWTSNEGLFAAVPPRKKNNDWHIIELISRPVSDAALCDIDGCGEDEIITIEPFHGSHIVVNKNFSRGFEIVWHYPDEIEFAHTVTGCSLLGRPAVLCGTRRKNCELFVLQYESGKGYFTTLIEEGAGTSNAAVINADGTDIIIAANNIKNEAAVYYVRDTPL